LKALKIPEGNWNQTSQNRVAKVLHKLGFTKYRARTAEDGRPNRYRKTLTTMTQKGEADEQ
jgi:hypothetical protein